MLRKFYKSLLILILFSMLISCGGRIFYFYSDNIKRYEEPEPVLTAQRADIDAVMSKIIPTKSPVSGSAIVILPSKSYIERKLIVWEKASSANFIGVKNPIYNLHATAEATGNLEDCLCLGTMSGVIITNLTNIDAPQNVAFKKKANNFIVSYAANVLHATAEAVVRRKIFDMVVITTNDEPENASFSEDIAIILLKNKEGKAQWFLKKKKGSASAIIEIEEMSTALPPVQRVIVWLNNVEKASRSE